MNPRSGRRQTDPHLADPELGQPVQARDNLPVLAGPAKTAADPVADATRASPYEAQVLGQPGVKRGLRGGPEVLGHARSAYLEAEYSGPADRRPPRGVITRKDI